MNLTKLSAFSIGLLTLFSSCKRDNNNSFAIRDFSKSLQPYLIDVVSKGIVGYDSSTRFIQAQATDKELEQLSKSELPILRAVAFRSILGRKGFNHFDLIMSHLNDTAIVSTDAGEWGIRRKFISDDILEHARWKDSASKDITIDSVILYHNYLKSAYRILWRINPKENLYSSIKDMAQREVPYGEKNQPDESFEEREDALYSLATFKKAADIQFIKGVLLQHLFEMGESSFSLMQQYPNDAYLEIFKAYYPREFYRFICRCRNEKIDEHQNFLESLASYKSDSSAAILTVMFSRGPFIPCFSSPRDSSSLKWDLMRTIWDNPCPAYSKLRKQIEGPMEEDDKMQEKFRNSLTFKPEIITTKDNDNLDEPVRWW